MTEFFRAASFMFVLLNPFLVIIYLINILQRLTLRQFFYVLLRAGIISCAVFSFFSVLGDAVFAQIIQAEFASFQIFGGVVFFLIGLQFVFRGPKAIQLLRGDSKNLAGGIAMPILIGPGTISAAVLIGKRLPGYILPIMAIVLSVGCSLLIMGLLKYLHDFIKPRRESIVEHYIEIAGRITVLFVGTFSIEMIMRGIRTWADKF